MRSNLQDIGKHILVGIKHAVPVLVIYSVALALVSTNIIRSDNFDFSHYIYLLIIPILTASIANSICQNFVFTPGLILGYFFERMGIGFFGGIIGGLLLGYLARFFTNKFKTKDNVYNLFVGYIVIGGISYVISYYMILLLVAPGITEVLAIINSYISGIDKTEVVLLVGVLAFLTTIDLGGPFNKLAYSFYISFYLDGFYYLSGPVLISTVIPPLSIYLALKLMPNRFNYSDQQSRKIALFGSFTGLTEGALIVAFRRPLKVIPILVVGSVMATVFAAAFGLENRLLLASVLGLLGTSNLLVYFLSHLIGVGIVLILFVLFLPKNREKLVDL